MLNPDMPKIYQFEKDVNNMSHQYMSVSETYNTGRTSYGIAVLQTISDISEEPEQIRDLVRRCNENHLSPLHLPEVIEDFLAAL